MAPTFRDDWETLLRALKPDWDSYKGKPITDAAIDAVKAISIVPASDGGIHLCRYDDGLNIEWIIDPTGKFDGIFISKEG